MRSLRSVTLGAALVAGVGFAGAASAQTIGVSWSNFQEERWKTDEAAMKTCFPCHEAIKDRDFVFTRYTP